MYYSKKGKRPTRVRETPNGPVVGYDIQPIRDLEKLGQIQERLARNPRNEFMFLLGINSGLRISDLLWLTVRDVRRGEHMVTRELKTGKVRRFFINEHLRPVIDEYIKGMHHDDYLFASNRWPRLPITRHAAYRILREAGESVGLHHVGTHSMRKTFGYHHYRMYKDVVTLMMIFNHREQSDTLDYIGWTQELVDESLKGFFLGRKM
ncbi:site-specific integrase [Paenibacillus thiaminolyticus]|uniref:Site-specific integrase n=1 Tax=Paenibacillus thiaminolyticus TaxID=49283 RepID=A0A3A3GGG5_PANTH|nr:site-specific integrase [Paenibacillus thiaminolyticus]RJG23291.1 site-specific integrase [Paenibacillus thiaminolyticus]RJG23308.1 site-specific integrase [Paenibacillus thiaminolyticus]